MTTKAPPGPGQTAHCTNTSRLTIGSTLESLLKDMKFVVTFRILGAIDGDLAYCMQHRGVITTTEQVANFRQTLLRQFLGQVHGDLAWTSDIGRTLFGIHVSDFDTKKVGNGFLDVFDGNLPVLNRQEIFQRIFDDVNGDVLAVEARVGQDLAQGAFKLAHVGTQMLGDKEGDIVRQLHTFLHGFFHQNGNTHFQLGRLDGDRQAGIEARNQTVVHAADFLGIGVAGDDDLLFCGDQRFKSVEKLFLGAVLAAEELNIVDQQQIKRVVITLEVIKTLALISRDYVAHILLGMDITDPGGRIVGQHLVANGVNDMGLAKADAAVQKQRVIGHSGIVGDLGGGSARQLVGLPGDEVVESQHRIDARLFLAQCDRRRFSDGFLDAGRVTAAMSLILICRRSSGYCTGGTASGADARVEHELDFDPGSPIFGSNSRDATSELGFDPVEFEAVGRSNTQVVIFIIKRRERLDPGAILLRRQLLLQLCRTGQPKIFHESSYKKQGSGKRVGPTLARLNADTTQAPILLLPAKVIHRQEHFRQSKNAY